MSEWLRHLEQSPGAYSKLLDENGVALAAYSVAAAKIRAWCYATPIPTPPELHAAAMEIVDRSGRTDDIPTPAALASLARAAGLPVLSHRSSPPIGTCRASSSSLHRSKQPMGGLERRDQTKPEPDIRPVPTAGFPRRPRNCGPPLTYSEDIK